MLKFSDAFYYENNFYLTCDSSRIAKILAHYELFKMVLNIPGEIVECGVFKGASLSRFAMFRSLLSTDYSKKIIAFDIFGFFPSTSFESDKPLRDKFIELAGGESITVDKMEQSLKHKRCNNNVELIKGDICKTIPNYIEDNPHLKISFLNLDTDIYEPCVTILDNLWDRIVRGGVLILDDYGVFPGETKAVDDFFRNTSVEIKKFHFTKSPSYIIKE